MGRGKGQCLGLSNSHWSPVHYAQWNKDIFFPSKLVDVQLFLPKLSNSADLCGEEHFTEQKVFLIKVSLEDCYWFHSLLTSFLLFTLTKMPPKLPLTSLELKLQYERNNIWRILAIMPLSIERVVSSNFDHGSCAYK